MPSVEFKADAALQAMRDQPKRTQTATVRALNRTLTSGKAFLAGLIAKDMGVKTATVKDAIREEKATPEKLQITLRASKKRLTLAQFGAKGPDPSRGKGRGVSYRLGPGGRGRVSDAFVATMPTGHRGIYRRAGKSRLPIFELYGPSIGHVFDKYREQTIDQMRETFDARLAHELQFAKDGGA
jgi:hypothetical protein